MIDNFLSHADNSSDRAWDRLVSAHKYGDCLVTIATFSEMTEADEALTGLVGGHAYAVLDIREAGLLRMLKVKNPWAHRPWRGRFSPSDTTSWTVGLKSALGIKAQVMTQFNIANSPHSSCHDHIITIQSKHRPISRPWKMLVSSGSSIQIAENFFRRFI